MIARIKQYSICLGSIVLPVCATALTSLHGKPLLPKKPLSAQGNIAPMPIPDSSDPTKLSLTNAVLLSLRRNPNLKMDFNNRKVQRYDLITAEQHFAPQFSLSGTYLYNKNASNTATTAVQRNTSIGPTVNWDLPLGTSISGGYTYNPQIQTGDTSSETKTRSWNITVTQPLLQGFGWNVNMVGLRNARDDQTKADYTLENNVITTITQVMSDYYAVVQAKQTLQVDKNAYKDAHNSYKQRLALFQAGRVSRSDLTQAELTATQKQTSISSGEQKFNLAREKLMNDLALPDNTKFHVDNTIPVHELKASIPKSIKQALKHNLDLKIAKIAYREAKRNLLTSENNELPKLNLIYTDNHHTTTETQTTPTSSNTKTIVDGSSIELSLTLPLDRTSINQKSLQSAITMQNEQITMQNQKRQLENNVITAVENLRSAWMQIHSDKVNLRLAKNNFKAAQVKYQYGKIDAFDLAQQQEQLQTSQNAVINDQISYLQAVSNYEKLTGTILTDWHIHLEGMKHATQI